MLKRLEETSTGCHMGSRFTWALTYANDITLLVPCKSALSIPVRACEKYAPKFYILFNSSRSKLLFFNERFLNRIESIVRVSGKMVDNSDNAVGHTFSFSDREIISLTAKSSFWKSFNSLYLILVIYTILLTVVCLNNFVVVFMVHHYGI